MLHARVTHSWHTCVQVQLSSFTHTFVGVHTYRCSSSYQAYGCPYIEVISTINGASSSSLFHDFLLPLLVPVPSTLSTPSDCFDEWVIRLMLTIILPACRIETWGCSGRGLSVLSVFLWPMRTLITRPLGILKLIGRPFGTSPNDLCLAALIGIGGAGKSSLSEKISWWPRWLIYINRAIKKK